MTIRKRLLELKDEKNAAFQAKLTPGIPRESFLGTRVPQLRLLEKEFRKKEEVSLFLKELPHKYYDENLLHSIFISNMKDYDQIMTALDEFLPYMDNWAVCDTLHPSVFKKKKDGLMDKIHQWVVSPETYTCRFGINILMTYYLDQDFQPEYLEIPASVHSEEYYINMMIAWYYATALAKQWDATIPYLEQNRLDTWVHNKTIQKARESFRITPEQKEYLKTLKRK
ncbi:MAG: DNA alkylation repair protein [Eubacteriales bacterium]|nr:DNA alkylation repair protein [Eubacteriales bacterium]